MTNIKLTSSQFDMYHNEKLYIEKQNWISVSKGMIYISKGHGGRWYWILNRIKSSDRPSLKFNDEKLIIKIGTFKLIIHSRIHFEQIKRCIIAFAN